MEFSPPEGSRPQPVSTKSGLRQKLRGFLQWAFILVVLFFVARYLQNQWGRIDAAQLQVNVPMLILAQLVLLMGMGLHPFGGWFILRGLGANCTLLEIWRAFFISQVAKYLPGSIWSLPSRTLLYHRYGLNMSRSAEAVIWESGLSVIGATLVGALGLPLLSVSPYLNLSAAILLAFMLIFTAIIIVMQSAVVEAYRQKLPETNRFFRFLKTLKFHLSLRQITLVILIYAADWLVIGLGFGGIVYAFGSDLSLNTGMQLTGLFAMSWAVGFLVIISPGGIGVRDALLVVGLSGLFHDPLPLVVAVVARIAWMISEVAGLLISTLVYTYVQRTTRTPLGNQVSR